MLFDVRQVQTKVKHTILAKYAGAWAGIIGNGVRLSYVEATKRGRQFLLDMVYVDGFGGAGAYAQDFDGTPGPVWGSPIVAMKALEAHAKRIRDVPVRLSAVIVESNPTTYDTLVANLRSAGLNTPIATGPNLTSASFGKISVICGDFRDHVESTIRWMGPHPFAFVLVDPDGPSMAMSDVQLILRRPRTDAIVLFPFYDLQVHGSGSAAKADEAQTRMDKQNIALRSKHFGTSEWIEIVRTGVCGDDLQDRLVALYLAQLRGAANGLIVKNIPLQLGTIARTAYHLCLATRDADGAMRMNDVLRDAEVDEELIRWRGREMREQALSAADQQGSLALGLPLIQPPTTTRARYSVDEVADAIRRLAHGSHTLKEIYGLLADELYTSEEIRQALKHLNKNGEAKLPTGARVSAPIQVVGRPLKVH